MTILVFGRHGQVAQALQRHHWGTGALVHPVQPAVIALGSHEITITDPTALTDAIDLYKPSLIINAAAYTAVDRAQTDVDAAFALNAKAPAYIAQMAARRHIPFMHLSTDYVFDGTASQPYAEDTPTQPLGVYGASKLAGEEAVTAAGGPHIILRTSWVFSQDGHNFVKTMLRLAQTRPEIRVVADQIGRPTAAHDIAIALDLLRLHLVQGTAQGIFHFGSQSWTSWYGFAEKIFAIARNLGYQAPTTLLPINTTDYPTPAQRPAWSVLSCRRYENLPGAILPDWATSLDKVMVSLRQAGF